jgi:hypothetical protein
MATLPELTLPYGMRDVKLKPYSAAGVLGTAVDLPAMQTLSWSEAEEFATLRGDDTTIAIRGRGASGTWDLEAGGISLEAFAVLNGGTLTSTGTTPARVKKLNKKGATVRPYFKAEGQAVSDSGGDVHAVLYKCRATGDLGGEHADGEFFVTSASGEFIPDVGDDLYDIVYNEGATAIT